VDPLRVADRLDGSLGGQSLRRIARYGMAPDPQALFVPAAFTRAGDLAQRADAIYASGMPWSGLLAAAALKIRSGRPAVLGLRDPWVEPTGVRHGAFRNRIESLLEGLALRHADAVVVTAAGLRDDLRNRRPNLHRRVWVIPNGYDEEDFEGTPAAPLGPFDIVHTGNFYGTKGPADLFEGLRLWLATHPERRNVARLRLVGPARDADREAARRAGLSDVVVFEGAVPHGEAVARLRASRVAAAVDFGPEQAATRVLSKIFEYMRSGLPILFLSSGGGTAEILRPCPRAIIVRRDDPQAIAGALESIASRPPMPSFVDDAYTRTFERRVLAGKFAEVLDDVSAGPYARAR
jgi:glycosyltransferase involved in cell wall biosynthesis